MGVVVKIVGNCQNFRELSKLYGVVKIVGNYKDWEIDEKGRK